MLNALLVDMKLDNLEDFSDVCTHKLRGACSEIDVADLQEILRKYTSTEDMFTQHYLHGRKENIKLLVDIGKVVDAVDTNPDKAHEMAHAVTEQAKRLVALAHEDTVSFLARQQEAASREHAQVLALFRLERTTDEP
jgi:hypothetical protein